MQDQSRAAACTVEDNAQPHVVPLGRICSLHPQHACVINLVMSLTREDFLARLRQAYGKDPVAFTSLIEQMDFLLLEGEDFEEIAKHLQYVHPKWNFGNDWKQKQGDYHVEHLEGKYYHKYFLARLSKAESRKDVKLFGELITAFFSRAYRYFGSYPEVVNEFVRQLATSTTDYDVKQHKDHFILQKFRCDLDKVKGGNASEFAALVRDMDFKLLKNGDGGDMQEIEVNHFGYEKAGYEVGKYWRLYKTKLHQVNQLTWNEFLRNK